MIITDNKRDILELLLYRWNLVVESAATQKLFIAAINHSPEAREAIPSYLQERFLAHKPLLQMELIKNMIVEILPEANFIEPTYESPAGLEADDFLELFCNHQKISIRKVKKLMKQMKI
jgi:hypothetical protein